MQPRKIGRYEIKDELGAGGMGQVYRAFDPQSNRDVALKVINLNALRRFAAERRDQVLKRFSNEVKVIAQLQHPAIVPLFDAGDDNGTPYMVMPLMAGGSLEKRLRDQSGQPQPLPFAEIERILTWITPALDKMHAQKVVHRDLKPDNILFDEDNHPYIANFGIAKLTEGSITFNTGVIGTPAYMSPEQADGQKAIDARSDVYSLGAVLYKMLTGERPYHKAHPAILPIYHIQEPPPRLDELRTDLSANWQAIIDRAMAKKPEERYQTAGELSTAVTQLLRNEAEQGARERKAREEAKRQAELARLRNEAEQGARERKAREEAKRQAELARLRREAEAARKQADTARQQALREMKERKAALRQAEYERQQRDTARQLAIREKKEREAALRQAENERQQHKAALRQAETARQQALHEKKKVETALQKFETTLQQAKPIQALSLINPLDHLRLLWWALVAPKELKRYQEQYGKVAIKKMRLWLGSILICLPFLFLILALELERLVNLSQIYPSTTYLIISGLCILWLLIAQRTKRSLTISNEVVEVYESELLARQAKESLTVSNEVAEVYESELLVPQAKESLTVSNEVAEVYESELLARQAKESLTVSNEVVKAYYQDGLLAYEEDRLDDATIAYQEVIRLDPAHVEAHNYLGSVFYLNNRAHDAIATLRRAIELDSAHTESYLNLGLIYKETGNITEAIQMFRRYLVLVPESDSTAIYVRELIEELS